MDVLAVELRIGGAVGNPSREGEPYQVLKRKPAVILFRVRTCAPVSRSRRALSEIKRRELPQRGSYPPSRPLRSPAHAAVTLNDEEPLTGRGPGPGVAARCGNELSSATESSNEAWEREGEGRGTPRSTYLGSPRHSPE
ncbi:hypothetical protein SKAU_G00065790 [Synaphobranchus kaupii]|uniref:Uncharacterized protein n=1 Tax=Synaphobranchus kaupii TaxID=118154 RepID=A0A9Q1G6Y3_SYNKA|nr:hypothetical protein SKAU_G00065790 [Synaphobranchus kaupii]